MLLDAGSLEDSREVSLASLAVVLNDLGWACSHGAGSPVA